MFETVKTILKTTHYNLGNAHKFKFILGWRRLYVPIDHRHVYIMITKSSSLLEN